MRALLLIPLALAGLCQPARAGAISSAYTDLDWKKDCVTYAQAEEGTATGPVSPVRAIAATRC